MAKRSPVVALLHNKMLTAFRKATNEPSDTIGRFASTEEITRGMVAALQAVPKSLPAAPGDFAALRRIADRQVLGYTEESDDGLFLHILLRLLNGANVIIKMTFSTEALLHKARRAFRSGGMDEKLLVQITQLELNVKCEPAKAKK